LVPTGIPDTVFPLIVPEDAVTFPLELKDTL
jgi:hypothetical protein